jgi:ribosomal-protein-alanine N-acetyltransferase
MESARDGGSVNGGPGMSAAREIVTARLILSEPRIDDARDVFERYASNPEVTRFLAWPRHESMAATEAFLAFSASEWQRWPAGPYLIRSRTDRELLGGTGLGFESPTAAVTGYVLAKDAWGQGYATEALAAMIEVARQVGVTHLSALCHPEHRASQRVLEKCGFVRDPDWSQPTEFPNLAPGVAQPVLRYELHLAPAAASAPRRDAG